jgi:hypothetical protein
MELNNVQDAAGWVGSHPGCVCSRGVKRTSFGHPEHPPMTQSGHRPEFKLRRQRRPSPPIKALASTSTILAPEPGANMRRREFFAGLTGALAMPLSAQAQQTMARTIGWFSLRSADTDSEKSILAAFRRMCSIQPCCPGLRFCCTPRLGCSAGKSAISICAGAGARRWR